MARLNQVKSKVQALDLEQVIIEAVTATQDDLTEENKKQLFSGLDSNGEIIGDNRPYKSEPYANIKNQMNPIPGLGNPDLRLTGEFYAGFTTEISGKTLRQYSRDEKNAELVAKYPFIFGLGPIAKKEYIADYLSIAVREQVLEAINL